MTANVTFEAHPIFLSINDRIVTDSLTYIFQITLQKNLKHFVSCASVCIFWRDITNKDCFWKEIARRLKIDPNVPNLRIHVNSYLHQAQKAIDYFVNQKPRRFPAVEAMFLAVRARIERLPENSKKRIEMQNRYDDAKKNRQEQTEILRAAFYGYLTLNSVGLCNLSEAEKITKISLRYGDYEPSKKLKELGFNQPDTAK